MQLNRAVNPSPIKSIQRGSLAISSSTSATVIVSPVAVGRAFLLINASTSGKANVGVGDGGIRGRINGAGELKFDLSLNIEAMVDWELVEYV